MNFRKQRDFTNFERSCLDLIESRLDDGLCSFVLIDSENIFDEDSDEVWRHFTFNRGIENYNFVISPNKEIKYFEYGVPKTLCEQIQECLN